MSPEMELFDLLGGEDEPLHTALVVFGWPTPAALEQAKHALWMMVQDGLIKVYRPSGSVKHIVPNWKVRNVLSIESSWFLQGE